MKTSTSKFIVQVLNQQKGVENAMVLLEGNDVKIRLHNIDNKGRYASEQEIPKGTYTVRVSRKPFEGEERATEVTGASQTEVFMLREKGQPFYYRGKVKVPFIPDENRVAIFIPDKLTRDKNDQRKSRLNEKIEVATRLAEKHKLRIDQESSKLREGLLVCYAPDAASMNSIRESIHAEIPNAAMPIIKLTKTGAAMLTNEVMVKFEEHVTKEQVERMAAENGFTVKRKMAALGNLYHLTSGKAPSYEMLGQINQLAELEEVIFAEPNLATTVEEDAITPTDFLFPEQWDHQIINTPDAWQFLRNTNVNNTFGSPDVIIAVVDSGVDPNHPDLNGTVSNGASKIYQAFDFANMVPNNNTLTSGHGTSCASAAASRANNPSAVAGINEGTAGIAGNSRILAIRREGTEADYANIYLWAGGFDPDSDDDDFPAQITPGAHVISSSIGISSAIGSPTSGTMAAVFDRLTDDGRDGRGTLLFFSAANNGNDNDITFERPWGMYERCFSIAASTLANDGITEISAPYSNYSSRTAICAPSQDEFVDGSALHNPTFNYGTFTATPTTSPEGDGTVGRPTTTSILLNTANAGDTVVSLGSVAGIGVGQAILFGAPGAADTEGNIITAINAGASTVTLESGLLNGHSNGIVVSVSARDYRSNFGGTSYSTPVCAGTAALMLSANPQLTWIQVRDILRNTAIKINPGETDPDGRWQDVNGNFSNSPAYNGNPFFSEFYGFGRLDTATAVRQAGWDIELVTPALDFNDVPAGDTAARAVRFNVKSLWPTHFSMTSPGSPFTALSTTESIGASPDADLVREVYFWVTYTGTNAGDEITMADGMSVTVQNPETEQQWTIPITANVIEKETAAIMLCLDQSGSMDAQSGIGSSTRMDILKFSANIMVDVLHEHNGLGIVAFDHDPYDVLDFTGPVGPPPTPSNPFEAGRSAMHQAINNFQVNPDGLTAIGDGIERAILRLDPVTTYNSKSIIVFTDGKETDPKYISDIADQITDRMFAIGLGKANAINPAALNEITNENEGYMLLADDLGEDSIFKLAKYFLQIQAGVNNEDVVVDPDGTLYGDQVHKIPFVVNEADIRVDVISMVPHPALIDFYLETPGGQIVKPADAETTPGLTYGIGNNVAYYRMNLPLPIGTPEKEGKWNAVLTINRKFNSRHGFEKYTNRTYAAAAGQGKVPYSLLVHSYSNLRMKTQVVQEHYEPGALLTIHVSLAQFGIPLNKPCKVKAHITLPDDSMQTLHLNPNGVGKYTVKLTADQPGYYQIRVKAEGQSLRGKAFTREQIRSASFYRGGNQPSPSGGNDPGSNENWCRLLKCLLSEKNISAEFKKRLKEQGINIDGMLECIQSLCSKKRGKAATVTHEKLRSQYESMIRVYEELMKENPE